MLEADGRHRFLAPEMADGIMEKQGPTPASDIFALAMTFFNTWTGRPPLHDVDAVQAGRQMKTGVRPTAPTGFGGLSAHIGPLFWALLVKMWASEPLRRPSSQDVCAELDKIFSSAEQNRRRVISTQVGAMQSMSSTSKPAPPPMPSQQEMKPPKRCFCF